METKANGRTSIKLSNLKEVKVPIMPVILIGTGVLIIVSLASRNSPAPLIVINYYVKI